MLSTPPMPRGRVGYGADVSSDDLALDLDTITLRRVADHVVELVLDRPQALNAISTAMARDLTAATSALAASRGTRAVVVSSSADRAFCVGADLKERNGFSDAELVAQRMTTGPAYRGVLDLPMPVVAAVHGFALGGGFEIALSCDLVVADETAVVGLPEVSVGVIPGGGGTQLLTRRVGWSRAADLIFTGRRLEAAAALAHGCVDRVVPAGTARAAAIELATAVAANSPIGLRQAKRAMRLGLDVDLATGLAVEDSAWRTTAFSPDRAEGVRAWTERRAPQWPGDS
jgi:enoyl-CoA hydratase/carnithine racemase